MADFSLDPVFSVYKLVERRQDIFNVISHRQTMSIVSYLIEETARTDHVDNVVFAGFQYISKFLPQVPRYREVAQYADHVYVFGVPDAPVPEIPNLTYVDLRPEWQLTKEWFVVSHGPHLSTALATEELSNFNDPDDQRRFNGFWIFDDEIVAIMHDWLASQMEYHGEVDIEPETVSARHDTILQQMHSRFTRLLQRHDLDGVISDELARFLDTSLGAVR